jgi:hypothetical protein
MKIHVKLFLAVLVCAGTAANAAWPFGGKKDPASQIKASGDEPGIAAGQPAAAAGSGGTVITNANGKFVMRQHLRLDEKNEPEFRGLISARDQTRIDLAVLKRLVDEKQAATLRFGEQLRRDFGIDEKADYTYDADTGTILMLVAKKDAKPANATAGERKEFKKLTKPEDQQRFVQLATARKTANEQSQTLALIFSEKSVELQMILDRINKKYSTSTDRNYNYDTDTRTLYELVPVPEASSSAIRK